MIANEITIGAVAILVGTAVASSVRGLQGWAAGRRSAALIRKVTERSVAAPAQSRARGPLLLWGSLAFLALVLAPGRWDPPVTLALLVAIAYAAWRATGARRGRRSRLLRGQLPAAVHQIASSLGVGQTIYQAVQRAARETPEPLGGELRRLVERMAVNMSLAEAFALLRRQIPETSGPIIAALEIQRTVGGDLAALLSELSRGLLAQEQLRSEISVLTAQARYSALIVGAVPWATLGMFAVFFFEYVRPLVDASLGRVFLAMAAGLAVAGYVVARRIAAGAEALAQ